MLNQGVTKAHGVTKAYECFALLWLACYGLATVTYTCSCHNNVLASLAAAGQYDKQWDIQQSAEHDIYKRDTNFFVCVV